MYQVYVLRSLKSGKRYVGVTKQPLGVKLKEHNQGATFWTRNHMPFHLIHCEKFESKELALKRERFFKTGNGRKVLDNILRH